MRILVEPPTRCVVGWYGRRHARTSLRHRPSPGLSVDTEDRGAGPCDTTVRRPGIIEGGVVKTEDTCKGRRAVKALTSEWQACMLALRGAAWVHVAVFCRE